ncbi:MAG: uracil-DNA glycosylase [Planctomycetota bacterium]|nr:MAG: uracil-DNA glycosylase [Planctomycetota bacterium]
MGDPDRFFARFPLAQPCWRPIVAGPDLAASRSRLLDAIIAPFLPDPEQVFAALEMTALAAVRVVIIGQDPYPTPGDAHGLCFSVAHGRPPRSLRNIFTEIQRDCGGALRQDANLSDWARQGVLLLNSVLTTPPGCAGGHKGCGWEDLTRAILSAVLRRPGPVVLMLWGRQASAILGGMSLRPEQLALRSGHPSPLAYNRKGPGSFYHCGHFASCNAHLKAHGAAPIVWAK